MLNSAKKFGQLLTISLTLSFWLLVLSVALLPDTEKIFGFDIDLNYYQIDLPESFRDGLQANRYLSNAVHLYANEIRGPESFAMKNGTVYTGLDDGRIIELLPNNFRVVAFLPGETGKVKSYQDCQKQFFAAKHCSRAIGMRFSDSNGLLYVVDSNHGVYEVNVENGAIRLVMDINRHKLPDGSSCRFLDDLLVTEIDGHLAFYLSDASAKWSVEDAFFVVGEHEQAGKLLRFDTVTEQLIILKDNLSFPNGIEFASNKTAILLNELNKRRILRYDLQEPDQNKAWKVLVDSLPGEPDNIKRSLNPNSETFWVALFTGRNSQKPSLWLDFFGNSPYLRRFAFRLIRLTGFILQTLGETINVDYIAQIGFDIRVANFLYNTVGEYGMAIEIDSDGKIINSLHSPDGQTSTLSEVHEFKRTLTERHFYLGSFSNRYIGRLKVKIEDLANENEKHEETKLVEENRTEAKIVSNENFLAEQSSQAETLKKRKQLNDKTEPISSHQSKLDNARLSEL